MSNEPEAQAGPPLQEIEPLHSEEMKAAIARELYVAMEKLGAPRPCLP